jgi:hypothetical protein
MCLLRKERTGFVELARKRIGRLKGAKGLKWLELCKPYCRGTYPPAAAPSRFRKVSVKLDQGCSINL